MNDDFVYDWFCKECGSTIYDKEWGLSHMEGCPTTVERISEPVSNKPSSSKPKTIWSESMENDLNGFHSDHD